MQEHRPDDSGMYSCFSLFCCSKLHNRTALTAVVINLIYYGDTDRFNIIVFARFLFGMTTKNMKSCAMSISISG